MEDTKNKPLASIIIPCYNYGHVLREAIESAFDQTYRPLEVIVVNDGSTDDTIDVASQYPVILHNQENQGAARAYNRGIELSGGEYVVILSADDKLHPSFVEKTMHVLERYPQKAFAYTHVVLFGLVNGILLSREYDIEKLKMTNFITGTALIRKQAFQLGGLYDPYIGFEDYDLWLSFAEKKQFGILLPEPLFYYRQQPVSRNTMTIFIYIKNLLKVWKKHRKLYSIPDIVKNITFLILHRSSVLLVDLMRTLLPGRFRMTISAFEKRLKAFRGFEFVAEEQYHDQSR
jgi:glycosyltransferase involved in cell wall biosynthesis